MRNFIQVFIHPSQQNFSKVKRQYRPDNSLLNIYTESFAIVSVMFKNSILETTFKTKYSRPNTRVQFCAIYAVHFYVRVHKYRKENHLAIILITLCVDALESMFHCLCYRAKGFNASR